MHPPSLLRLVRQSRIKERIQWGRAQHFHESMDDFWPPRLLLILYMTKLVFIQYLGSGQVQILSGSRAAARTGQGAERCGHGLGQLRHFLGRALRLGQARGPSVAATWSSILMSNIYDPCTKLIGGGGAGGPKVALQEYTQLSSLSVNVFVCNIITLSCLPFQDISLRCQLYII